MNKIKLFSLILVLLLLTGCSLPYQSVKYPGWKTKGVLESYTLSDGRVVDGWVGDKIGSKINAKWYDFTVNYAEIVDYYEGVKAEDGKVLVHASISITNTSDKVVYLFDGDFALVWDLENDERSYAYSMDPYFNNMLTNDEQINVGETKVIHTVYQIDKSVADSKTMAIYYHEQYSDGQRGNNYYIYII